MKRERFLLAILLLGAATVQSVKAQMIVLHMADNNPLHFTIGLDISTANESGGNFTFGFSMHAGGGSSNTHGTVTSAHNKYSFGGAGLHAGYQNGNFNIFGSFSYSRGEHVHLPAYGSAQGI